MTIPPTLRRLVPTAFFALLTCASSIHAAPESLGVNFGFDTLFANRVLSARPEWAQADDLNSSDVTLDTDGWPTQDAALMVWEGAKNNHGMYFIQFTGEADLETSFGYGNITEQNYDPKTNTTTARMEVTSPEEQNFSLIFRNSKRTPSSETGSGITNLKVMRPVTPGATESYPPDTLYTNQIETLLKKFSVGRLLDLTRVNNNPESEWKDRNVPSHRRQDPLSWEYVVQLANHAGRDVYINIPHLATDDYILKLAQLFRYGSDGVNPYTSPQEKPVHPPLNPDRRVYIEWSNEVWNPFFTQFSGIEKRIRAAIQSPNEELKMLNYDNLDLSGPDDQGRYNNQYQLMRRYHAKRTVDTSNIWRKVFGDEAMGDKVRVVLEWQYEDLNGTASDPLTFINDYYNNADGQEHVADPHPVNYFLWGAGGATYFSTNDPEADTIDGIFQAGIPEKNYDARMRNTYAWAKAFGLKAVSYEGGWAVEKPGGNGFLNPPGSAQSESKYDPRAKDALLKAHRDFEEAGGDLNVLYTATGTRDYVWGMTDDIYNLETPLYQAVDAINAAPRAPATAGTKVPGDVPAGAYVKSEDPESTDVRYVRSGWKQVYLINAPADGAYTLTIDYDTGSANNPTKVIVNGTTVAKNFDLVDQGSGWGNPVDSPALPIELKAGLNAILLSLTSGDLGLHHLKIAAASGEKPGAPKK